MPPTMVGPGGSAKLCAYTFVVVKAVLDRLFLTAFDYRLMSPQRFALTGPPVWRRGMQHENVAR